MTIFEKDADYEAFERVLEEAVDRSRTRLLAFCVMPNDWHLIVWPRQDGELSQFVGWLTLTHTQRWHAIRHSRGSGHVYQGRFKSFPVQGDEHFLTACRYVERNALRGEPGRPSGSLALVQPAPPSVIKGRWPHMAVGLASGASQALGEAGKDRADRSRASRPSSLHCPWQPVRRDIVVQSNGAAPRPGDDASSPRAAQEAT